MNIHTGSGFKCGHPGCTHQYPSKKALNTHIRLKHTKIPRVHCNIPGCDYTTDYYERWNVHLKNIHNIGEVDYKCPNTLCQNRDFSNSKVYERHMRSYHLPRDEQCLLCKRWFKGEDNLDKHLSDSHSGNQYQCDVCGQVFGNHNQLKVHMSTQHKDD